MILILMRRVSLAVFWVIGRMGQGGTTLFTRKKKLVPLPPPSLPEPSPRGASS